LGAFVLNEALHFEAYIGFGLIAMGLLILDGRILKRFFRKSIA
jgi:uncharacterized membrane protein